MYGKIFESIYDGTIAVDWKAMVVFQQLIVLCDSQGVIDMTPCAISRRTNIPLDIIKDGLDFLSQPDEHSRSKAHDGKRIILISDERDWGWQIVNHKYYRDLASREDKREKDRVRIADKRAQVVDSTSVSQVVASSSDQSQMSPMQDARCNMQDASKGIVKTPSKKACPYAEILNLFHEKLDVLPRVLKLNPKRKRYIKQLWNDDLDEMAKWVRFFEHVGRCDFLIGKSHPQNNRKPFIATLEWITNPSNFIKIAEGNYDNVR